jgi:hypothetical protein
MTRCLSAQVYEPISPSSEIVPSPSSTVDLTDVRAFLMQVRTTTPPQTTVLFRLYPASTVELWMKEFQPLDSVFNHSPYRFSFSYRLDRRDRIIVNSNQHRELHLTSVLFTCSLGQGTNLYNAKYGEKKERRMRTHFSCCASQKGTTFSCPPRTSRKRKQGGNFLVLPEWTHNRERIIGKAPICLSMKLLLCVLQVPRSRKQKYGFANPWNPATRYHGVSYLHWQGVSLHTEHRTEVTMPTSLQQLHHVSRPGGLQPE